MKASGKLVDQENSFCPTVCDGPELGQISLEFCFTDAGFPLHTGGSLLRWNRSSRRYEAGVWPDGCEVDAVSRWDVHASCILWAND